MHNTRPPQVRTFTQGAISPLVSVLTAAAILLISDLLGGMRSVAYTGARGLHCFSHLQLLGVCCAPR